MPTTSFTVHFCRLFDSAIGISKKVVKQKSRNSSQQKLDTEVYLHAYFRYLSFSVEFSLVKTCLQLPMTVARISLPYTFH